MKFKRRREKESVESTTVEIQYEVQTMSRHKTCYNLQQQKFSMKFKPACSRHPPRSTTVEIQYEVQTFPPVIRQLQSTTVEIQYEVQTTYHKFYRQHLQQQKFSMKFKQYGRLCSWSSTTVEIQYEVQTSELKFRPCNLQQQKFSMKFKLQRQRKRRAIYNSRNLV